MAATVPVDAPWRAPQAAEWDGQTFETWLSAPRSPPRRASSSSSPSRRSSRPSPRDLSLLFVLFYIAARPGTSTSSSTRPAAPRRAGSSAAPSGSRCEMAKQLGSVVQLEQPVRRSRRGKDGVVVRTRTDSWAGKRVIVTVPPALVGSIRFQPGLPPNRAQLDQRVPMGTVIKCMAIYDRPFWRDEGLTGSATSTPGRSSSRSTTHRPTAAPASCSGSSRARPLATWPTRLRRAARCGLDCFVRYFGSAAEPGSATTSTRTGQPSAGAAAATSASRRRASWSATRNALRARSGRSTGPAPRPRGMGRLHGRRDRLRASRRRRGPRRALSHLGGACADRHEDRRNRVRFGDPGETAPHVRPSA